MFTFKKLFYFLITCILSISPICWAQPSKPAVTEEKAEPVTPLNRIVAIVNDEVIAQSDLDEAIDQLKQQLTANKIPLPPAAKLREDALEQLITYRLLLQMANRNDLQASDEEISQSVDRIAQSHNLSVEQLKQQLAMQNSDFQKFRKKLSEQIVISRLQQQMVAGKVKVTDEEITQYRNAQGAQEYQLADFFFPLSEHPSDNEVKQALTQAQTVKEKLESGASPDLITPPYRDLGWRTPNDLPHVFAEQLPKLTVKNASQPLRAPNGYHVLKLIEVRNTRQTMTDDQIRQVLFQQKFEAAAKAAVDKARNEAYVQIISE